MPFDFNPIEELLRNLYLDKRSLDPIQQKKEINILKLDIEVLHKFLECRHCNSLLSSDDDNNEIQCRSCKKIYNKNNFTNKKKYLSYTRGKRTAQLGQFVVSILEKYNCK